MNAAVVESFASPPRYQSFEEPVPGEDEVLVRVSAAGLHPIVKALANGSHYGSSGVLPFIAGVDGVGHLEDGTRVLFGLSRPPFGTFAERCVTKRATCLPVPAGLEDTAVAGMMNPGMSSYGALTERAHFAAGESLLILGATGTAGHLAVQLAKRLGARRVVAAGRNREALEELRAVGADAVISLQQEREALVAAFREEMAKDRIDVVLDYVWGAPAEAMLAAISQKGLQHAASRIRYIQVGSSAGQTITLPGATLRSSGLELLGSGFGSIPIETIFRSSAAFLEEAARKPFQFSMIAAPLRDIEKLWSTPEKAGRIVFRP